jgi:hypothetical protein
MDDLGIGILLTHLFDAAVNVATVGLQVLYDLSLERYNKPQYTMGGGMLGAHIDMVFLLLDILYGQVNDFFHN